MHAIAVVHQSGLNLPAAERRRVHTADLWRVKNRVQHPRDPGWDDGRYCKCHWQFRNAAARMTGEVVVDCVNDRKGKGYAVRSFFTVSKIAPCVHGKTLMFTDRKSTRLNSSHVRISYAVFCLKKKKPKN